MAQGSIVINTSSLQQAVQTSAHAGKQIKQGLQEAEGGAKSLNKTFELLSGGIQGMAAAAGIGAVIGLARMTVELGKLGAEADRIEAAFGNLATVMGRNAEEMLSSMQRAAHGTIANTDLMLSANRAMLLGVGQNAQQLADLLEVARVRGQAMGEGAQQAFNDIVIGIGRMSPRILDNLGIVIDEKRAYDEFAKSIGTTADQLTDAGKRQALLNAVLKDGKILLAQNAKSGDDNASAFERAAAAAKNAHEAFARSITPMMVAVVNAYAAAVNGLADALERTQGKSQWEIRAGIGRNAGGAINAGLGMTGQLSPSLKSRTSIGELQRHPLAGGGDTSALVKGPDEAAIRAAQLDWYQSTLALERHAGQERVDATRQYEQQRTETIRSHEQTIAREAQDFAISRKRQAEDLARSIAEIQADGARRLGDIEEEYHKQRERMERDHRDRLIDAAGHLDAVAFLAEQKNYARQKQDSDDAHTRQLDDAREADARRIQDLRDNLARQQAIEDEDRALSQERDRDDFAQQLLQQDAQQVERLAQISRHAGEERQALDEEWQKQMAALGIHNAAYDKEVEKAQAAATAQARAFYENLFANLQPAGIVSPTGSLAPLPAGPRGNPGNPTTSHAINVQPGAIVVNGAPGQSEQIISDLVMQKLTSLLTELGN